MNRIDELDKLNKAIKDAEIALKSIQVNIEQIDKEISILGPRRNELEQNLEFHKKADTVPIAHEYKKSKAELSKTKARLILINADRGRASQACKDIEFAIEKFKKEHGKLASIGDDNILRPSFGGKNGKK